MIWALRFLLLLLVIRAVVRLVAGFLQGLQPAPAASQPPGRALVRDPVCGTFVVPNRAVSLGDGATQHFFCSERCREKYRGTG